MSAQGGVVISSTFGGRRRDTDERVARWAQHEDLALGVVEKPRDVLGVEPVGAGGVGGDDDAVVAFVAEEFSERVAVRAAALDARVDGDALCDGAVLDRRKVLKASLELTAWLRCRFAIRVRDVVGHSESLSSPYHEEKVARLRTQTHADMSHAAMKRYRAKLRRMPCPTEAPR